MGRGEGKIRSYALSQFCFVWKYFNRSEVTALSRCIFAYSRLLKPSSMDMFFSIIGSRCFIVYKCPSFRDGKCLALILEKRLVLKSPIVDAIVVFAVFDLLGWLPVAYLHPSKIVQFNRSIMTELWQGKFLLKIRRFCMTHARRNRLQRNDLKKTMRIQQRIRP